jgi:hypothetical protein
MKVMYDVNLSDVFFTGLGIPDPDVHLGVGSGSDGVQTGAVLGAMDPVLELERTTRPGWPGWSDRSRSCRCRWRCWPIRGSWPAPRPRASKLAQGAVEWRGSSSATAFM